MYNKYRNIKAKVGNKKFDSIKEARRFQELKLLEKGGVIDSLELQPRFVLQDKFKYNGKTIRKIEYIADFMYRDNELCAVVVEDVKPSAKFQTEVYRIKKKMFLKKYGDEYIFKEVY